MSTNHPEDIADFLALLPDLALCAQIAVIEPHGGRGAVASMFLDDLVAILGLRSLGQLALPLTVEGGAS